MGEAWLAMLVLVLSGGWAEAVGQGVPFLAEGTRVRVHVPREYRQHSDVPGSYIGYVESVGERGLVMRLAGKQEMMAFTLPEVRKLEVSLGRRMPQGTAFLLGAGVVSVPAYFAGLGMGGLPVLAAVGGIGGLISMISNRERWEEVDLTPPDLDPRPEKEGAQDTPFSIPTIDLSGETDRQVVVDREPGQYLGHPTTVLLEDGLTILVVYPKGHGAGAIVMKRSVDGGLTWSERLPVPENWTTSREVPTLFRVVGPDGIRRLLLFSGLYPIRMARSEDEGEHWTPLNPIGDFGGIVAMASLVRLKDGTHMAFFHDDGRFLRGSGERSTFRVFKTLSRDGGLTWGAPEVVTEDPDMDLCEPGAVRSPDGNTLALLLRENSRRHPSMVVLSRDEGDTWTRPAPLPAALTGDRHTARYAPDGRLVVTFRDMAEGSPTKGDWVAWVGMFDDLLSGREGQYRVRLMDNKNQWDSAYPGLELLPDGTFVTTTYGHWVEGEEPFIVSVRFTMEELDGRLAAESERAADSEDGSGGAPPGTDSRSEPIGP